MKSIQLTNFRVFKQATSFDLAPITILTGKNSSGKSSLIRSFVLLSDYLERDGNQLKLELGGKRASKHKINTFENLKNWFSKSEGVKISYEIDDYKFTLEFTGYDLDSYAELNRFTAYLKPIDEYLILDYNYPTCEVSVSQKFIDYTTKGDAEKAIITGQDDFLKESKEIKEKLRHLSSLVHSSESGRVRAGLRPGRLNISSDPLIEAIEERHKLENRLSLLKSALNSKSKKELGINFQSEIDIDSVNTTTIADIIKSSLLYYIENSDAYKFTNQDERRYVLKFAEKIQQLMSFSSFHLGPNRTFQSRLYMNDSSGSEINKIIEEFVRNEPLKGSEADLFLKDWLKRFEIGESVEVESIEGMASKVEVYSKGRVINLADLGFGAGQLLTMLLQITTVIEKRVTNQNFIDTIIILIEEPEANLHPKLQSRLAELFVESSEKYNLQFILETHSEYFIRKLQLLVATDKIKPEQTIIYYLDCDAGLNETEESKTTGETSLVMEEQGSYLANIGCTAKRIEVFTNGLLSDTFGSGFFDEADEQALLLHRVQRKKQIEK